MTENRKLKLLLIAAGCDSAAVGEGGSSFHWVNGISQRHSVTLLTTRNSRRPPTQLQLPDVRVVEWPEIQLFEKWQRFNSMLKPSYVSFYLHARNWIKNSLRSGERFDLAHQISPLALRYPSPAAGLGMALVVGPLGGSIDNPKGFGQDFGHVPWYTQLRKLDEWRIKHDPWLRHTYASADRLIAVAPYVRDLLGDLPGHEVEFMTETGVVDLPPAPAFGKKSDGTLRLLFVGRVIRSKGIRDAIRAIAKLPDLDLEFEVVGDGDDLQACQHEARELGVTDRVIFHGRVPRKDVDPFYARADVFLFPSFREPSGNVVVEAMSYGLAIIAADRGGPGFVVDDTCGLRVPVSDPEQFATDIAACIRQLALHPSLTIALGKAAREKIRRQFLWETKVDRLEQIYSTVLDENASRSLHSERWLAPLETSQ